jgi:protein O-GlcNAc transferase
MSRQQKRQESQKQRVVAPVVALTPDQRQRLQALLEQGSAYHQRGQFADAESCYDEILESDSNHFDALYLKGVLAYQFTQMDVAESFLNRALSLRPSSVAALKVVCGVYFQQGKIDDEQRVLTKLQKLAPKDPEVLMNTGFLYARMGRHIQALQAYNRALILRPSWTEALMRRAEVYHKISESDAARKDYLAAISADLGFTPAIESYVAFIDATEGKDSAIEFLEKLIEQRLPLPSMIFAKLDTATRYFEREEYHKTIDLCRQVVMLESNNPAALSKLATALVRTHQIAEAEEIYFRLTELFPQDISCLIRLSVFYQEQKNTLKEEEYLRAAIRLDPTSPYPYYNLLQIAASNNGISSALALAEEAIQKFPQDSIMYVNVAHIYRAVGDQARAAECLRLALTYDPSNTTAHSNLLFKMHHVPGVSSQQIYEESIRWQQKHTADITPKLHHANSIDVARRLKVGYVSADFRYHPVRQFIEPVLGCHDHSAVEVYCYANQGIEDDATRQLRKYADHWRNIAHVSDDMVATLIEKDEIDILVDLSGHTAGNRLLVFARKPAPIQMTWIGYFNTTGVPAIDYIVADQYVLPPEDEHLYTERPLRISKSACYLPHHVDIAVSPLPMLRNGYITFGCFNAIHKMTDGMVQHWITILKRIPDARLYLKNSSFDHDTVRTEFLEKFVSQGIDASRIRFQGNTAIELYLKEHDQVDVMLDTFPYNAGTTGLDAFWMGVPMVGIRGDRMVSRMGEGMLGILGLSELVANTPEEYIEKAVFCAKNPEWLSQVRQTLRGKLEALPMTNPAAYTRELEEAYRRVWKEWCEKQTSPQS